jgi:hypothetical protein
MQDLNFDKLTGSMVNEIDISFYAVVLAIISSAICSYIIKLTYDRYGRSLNNRSNFSNNFVLLCVVTTLVIIIVKHSLALSLGLVGALSIVRFRAAIKEPEELIYLFLIISLGLCFGANQFLIGFVFAVSAVSVIAFLRIRSLKTDSEDIYTGSILILNGREEFYSQVLEEIDEGAFKKVDSAELKSFSVTAGRFQSTYKIDLTQNVMNKNQFLNSLMAVDNLDFELINDVVIPE